jgi:hypothetical protein
MSKVLTHPLVLFKGEPTNTSKKGFAIPQYAASLHKIMLALGYNEYVTQGGDWGFFITRALAHLYPTHVKGSRSNSCLLHSRNRRLDIKHSEDIQ